VFVFSNEGREEVLAEMKSMQEMGTTYYSASGDLYKLAGVLRAADIYWNPLKQ
jgi:hypothetical protein